MSGVIEVRDGDLILFGFPGSKPNGDTPLTDVLADALGVAHTVVSYQSDTPSLYVLRRAAS